MLLWNRGFSIFKEIEGLGIKCLIDWDEIYPHGILRVTCMSLVGRSELVVNYFIGVSMASFGARFRREYSLAHSDQLSFPSSITASLALMTLLLHSEARRWFNQ